MSRAAAIFRIELVPVIVLGAVAAGHLALVPGTPYWLDSPEFAASAFSLTLSHPPGHPLYETVASVFSLLPAGPVAFRMNLFSWVCSTAALALVMVTGMRILTEGFRTGRRTAAVAATLSVLPLAVSPGWIHQATHSEVYAFQALLLALMLLLSSRFLILPSGEPRNVPLSEPDDNFRWLAVSVGVFSLSLANHPFISILVLPALVAAVTTAAILRRWPRPGRRLMLLAAVLLVGLIVYAYVPIRGNLAPTMVMGRIEGLGDLLWTLSAKVYQKSAATGEGGLMTLKAAESMALMLRESGLVLPFMALGGLYVLLRTRPLLPLGVLLAVTTAVTLLSRALMPFDRNNPDIFGYLMIVMMIQPLAACAFAGAASKIRFGSLMGVLLLFAVVISAAAVNVPELRTRAAERDCPGKAMALLRRDAARAVPPFGKVFSSFYATTFLDLYDQKVLSSRPDVEYTGVAFLGYRGVAARAAGASEGMKRLIRGYLATGRIQASDLAYLALDVPVTFEPYPDLPDDYLPYLLPSGTMILFQPQPVSITDFKAATDESNDAARALVKAVGSCCSEPQTSRYLLWLLYNRALLIARRGYADGAVEAARIALSLQPGIPQLEALVKKLRKDKGPVTDIAPFLPPKVE